MNEEKSKDEIKTIFVIVASAILATNLQPKEAVVEAENLFTELEQRGYIDKAVNSEGLLP